MVRLVVFKVRRFGKGIDLFQFLHGAIGGVDSSLITSFKLDFNSYMVRLVVTIDHCNVSICSQFQFLHGAIGGIVTPLV